MQDINLADKYLKTLGLSRQEPTFEFLATICRNHAANFAFSSVGPLLGNELPLDTQSLFNRIVVNKRGGYCFEQNGLMYAMLGELGFTNRLYLARVIYNEDIHPPLTHRISMVEINDIQYVVDVGFGPLGPAQPVRMSTEETIDSYRTFRVSEAKPGIFHMQTRKDDGWFSLYKFELARYGQADCELGHFYSHKHPSASFVNNLVISVIEDDEVRSIRNREYCVTSSKRVQKVAIENGNRLLKLLNDNFDIEVSASEANLLFEKCD